MQTPDGSPFAVHLPHFKLGDFSGLTTIARGGEGKVKRATHDNLGNVAIKVLFHPVRINKINEIKILVEAKHPNIVQLFGILVSDYDFEKCNGYVMEFMRLGSLNNVITNPSITYDVKQIYSWIEQAGRGLKYLHDRNILHRDIKPNNMLLDAIDRLKLADFGLAREITIDGSVTRGIGTYFYMAPEAMSTRRYGKPADVYAFTISIWEMIHRVKPYNELEDISLVTFLTQIAKNGCRPVVDPSKVDIEMSTLLQRGWEKDPSERLSIVEMIEIAKNQIQIIDSTIKEEPAEVVKFREKVTTAAQIGNEEEIKLEDEIEARIKMYEAQAVAIEREEKIKINEIEIKRLERQSLADIKKLQAEIEQLRKENEEMVKRLKEKDELSSGVSTASASLLVGQFDSNPNSLTMSDFQEESSDSQEESSDSQEEPSGTDSIIYIETNPEGATLTPDIPVVEAAQVPENPNNEKGIAHPNRKDHTQTLMTFGEDILDLKIHILDTDNWEWKTISLKPPWSISFGGAVCLNNEIYIFGGEELGNQTYKLNAKLKWIQLEDMDEARQRISNSFLLFEECIWVFGGMNKARETLDTVEKYDPHQDVWIKMPSMKEKRGYAAAAVCEEKIFVCGGLNGQVSLKSVELFDPIENIWTMFVNLPFSIRGHAMISDGSNLIVMGGNYKEKFCKTVWTISTNKKYPKWKMLQSMKKERCFLTAANLGNETFAIGGHNQNTVEIFDGTNWRRGPEFPENICAVPSVVIPKDLADFLETANNQNVRIQKKEDNSTILLLGGEGANSKNIFILSKDKSAWNVTSLQLPHCIQFGGAVCLNMEIYIFGGEELEENTYKLNKKLEWVKLANLNESRIFINNSCLVFEGCIWVFGGKSSDEALDTVERYVPKQNKWEVMPAMSIKRYNAAATAYEGYIYVCNGENDEDFLSAVDCFDPFANVWTTFDSLPVHRESHAMTSYGNSLIVMGGLEENDTSSASSVWKIEMTGDSEWTNVQSMQDDRYNFTVASLGEEIFAIGGFEKKSTEIFDGKGWRNGPQLPGNTEAIPVVVIPASLAESFESIRKTPVKLPSVEGRSTIIVLGGGSSSSTVHILNSDRSQWTTISLNLPWDPKDGGAVCLNNEIYIFGGFKLLNRICKLEEKTWTNLASMNSERYYCGNSSLVFDGCIWIFGGGGNNGPQNTVIKCVPEENEWLKMPSMRLKRVRAAAAVCNGKIYVSGGCDVTLRPSRSVECFDPNEHIWAMSVDLPEPLHAHSMIADGSSLIVIGGENEKDALSTVWKIVPEEINAKWEKLPPKNRSQPWLTAVSLEKEIFAIEGLPDRNVQIFDGNKWRDGPNLPRNVSGCPTFVIPGHLATSLLSDADCMLEF